MAKQYLGDSVYVDRNQYGQLVLTTENGMGASNTIYLEPEVYQALKSYVDRPRSTVSGINNYLQVPIEEDDECPNCRNGTLELQAPDVYVCRGECGAFFWGPQKGYDPIGIDLKTVEKEKRAMLDELRKKVDMKAPEPIGRPCGCRDLMNDPDYADWDSSQPRCSCEGSCDCHLVGGPHG